MAVLGIPVDKLVVTRNGYIRFQDGSGLNVGLKAPSTATTNIDYTLPALPPSGTNQVLSATAGGVMSWVAQTGGGGTPTDVFSANRGVGAQLALPREVVSSTTTLPFRTVYPGNDSGGRPTCGVVGTGDHVFITPMGICPVGTILPWHKSAVCPVPYADPVDGPLLDDGWMECNGQPIPANYNRPEDGYTGPFPAGTPLPDLNGVIQASNRRYLRGYSTAPGQKPSSGVSGLNSENHTHTMATSSLICTGTDSPPRGIQSFTLTNTSHLPPTFNVVFIIRVR